MTMMMMMMYNIQQKARSRIEVVANDRSKCGGDMGISTAAARHSRCH